MKDKLKKLCLINGEAKLYLFVDKMNIILNEPRVPTLAVSKKGNLYIDTKFLNENEEYIISLLLHEAMHIYFNHVNEEYENQQIANIAQDIIINDKIINIGYKLPESAIHYETFDVPRTLINSRDIYVFLMENQNQISDEQLSNSKDQHELDDSELDDSEVEVIQQIVESIVNDVNLQEYKLKKQKYKLPSKNNLIKKLNKILGKYIKPDFTRSFSRPSRYRGENIIMPSSRGYIRTPSISLYLDVSGSMCGNGIEQAEKVISDLDNILKLYKRDFYVFNTETYKVDDFNKIELGGGTDFSSFHENDVSDLALIITDCEFSFNFLSSHKKKEVIVIDLSNKTQDIKNVSVLTS